MTGSFSFHFKSQFIKKKNEDDDVNVCFLSACYSAAKITLSNASEARGHTRVSISKYCSRITLAFELNEIILT